MHLLPFAHLVGNKPFRKLFYRLVDSDLLEDADKAELRDIEKRIFISTKEESSKEFDGDWGGSLKQNMKADQVIATKIRSAFRIYEKTSSNATKEAFFYFK